MKSINCRIRMTAIMIALAIALHMTALSLVCYEVHAADNTSNNTSNASGQIGDEGFSQEDLTGDSDPDHEAGMGSNEAAGDIVPNDANKDEDIVPNDADNDENIVLNDADKGKDIADDGSNKKDKDIADDGSNKKDEDIADDGSVNDDGSLPSDPDGNDILNESSIESDAAIEETAYIEDKAELEKLRNTKGNDRDVVPTGIFSDNTPALLLVILALIIAVSFAAITRRRQE